MLATACGGVDLKSVDETSHVNAEARSDAPLPSSTIDANTTPEQRVEITNRVIGDKAYEFANSVIQGAQDAEAHGISDGFWASEEYQPGSDGDPGRVEIMVHQSGIISKAYFGANSNHRADFSNLLGVNQSRWVTIQNQKGEDREANILIRATNAGGNWDIGLSYYPIPSSTKLIDSLTAATNAEVDGWEAEHLVSYDSLLPSSQNLEAAKAAIAASDQLVKPYVG